MTNHSYPLPNARFQARPKAAATQEHRLFGVACKPLLGHNDVT